MNRGGYKTDPYREERPLQHACGTLQSRDRREAEKRKTDKDPGPSHDDKP